VTGSGTPRDRVIAALQGRAAFPVPCVEHGIAAGVIEAAYGVKLPPVTGEPGSLEYGLTAIGRQKRINELTGRCNVEVPYHWTMAPRILKDGTHNGALTDRASLGRLRFVELTDAHWDTLKRIVDAKGEYALNVGITTGIGHIWQTMDLEAFAVATVEDRPLLREILARYTDWTCRVISACNTIGVDFYWCFDDFAFNTGTVYSPGLLREVVLPYARQVAAAIELPWIWHSDGNYMAVLDQIVSLGMNALNPLEPGCMDIARIMAAHPHLTLVGNVDVDLLAGGTVEQVRRAVREAFALMGRPGRYIAASGNSIPSFAIPANVRAMYEEIAVLSGSR